MKLTTTARTIFPLVALCAIGKAHPIVRLGYSAYTCPTTNLLQHELVYQTDESPAQRLYCYYSRPSFTLSSSSSDDGFFSDPNSDGPSSSSSIGAGTYPLDPYESINSQTSCVYDLDSGRYLDFIHLSNTIESFCSIMATKNVFPDSLPLAPPPQESQRGNFPIEQIQAIAKALSFDFDLSLDGLDMKMGDFRGRMTRHRKMHKRVFPDEVNI